MTPYERQSAEIETIKPRTFKINLSDADVKRLFEKATRNGITPEEIIENYLGDLLCGTRTNGSDERDLADAYFNRCHYNLGASTTFLRWAVDCGEYASLTEAIEAIDSHYYDEDAEYLKPASDYIAECYSEYKGYCDKYHDAPQTLEDGINSIREYYTKLNEMLSCGTNEMEGQGESDEQFEP
ncbi:MAG: molecular chaperone GrpE [Oscillospiraceae bacterium]